jgi:hypothetical protein
MLFTLFHMLDEITFSYWSGSPGDKLQERAEKFEFIPFAGRHGGQR